MAPLLPRFRFPNSPDALNVASESQDELDRLKRALRRQGAERRRLQRAHERLREEKREIHEVIKIAEALQDEVESLEEKLAAFEGGSLAQSLRDVRRSRQALSARYGRIYRALCALIVDAATRADAEQALLDVEDRDWVQSQLGDAE